MDMAARWFGIISFSYMANTNRLPYSLIYIFARYIQFFDDKLIRLVTFLIELGELNFLII